VIRLLVVDDSPLMRRLLVGIFTAERDFAVELARDGTEALEKLHGFMPDVITMDIHMPGMDGLASLDRIMLERPTPVVMVSALTARGAAETLEAMALGAVDFVAKPSGAISLEIEALAPLLVEKVRLAATARLSKTSRLAERVRLKAGASFRAGANAGIAAPAAPAAPARLARGSGLVLIGTSTGGPPALEAVLTGLPADFPWPILIAQHMPASFTGPLARRLDGLCALRIEEAARPTPLLAGHAYIARGDADVVVTRRGAGLSAMPAPENPEHRWHPSVDRMVASAMGQLAPDRLIGVLMTGMGDDGADTLTALKTAGGTTIAESEESAVVWGMPGSLVRRGGADHTLPLSRIATALCALVPAG
jgi:two-component system chemotaxis response regulator CheB